MADTARTREALLALLADNATGQISEQDVRDWIVTVMPAEFVNALDYWCSPLEVNLTSDKTTRGRHLYSQIVSSTLANGMSFGQVYCLTASNVWSTANVATSLANGFLGVAADSYAANVSTAQLLVWGIVYNSDMSIKTVSGVGRALYLQSTAADNSISVTKTANSIKVVGYVLPSGIGTYTAVGSGRFFFSPSWEIVG